jgi:hypothetical protein
LKKKKRNNFNRRGRSIICRYSEGKVSSIDISNARRELCVINEEMKGLCLSVQFKAYYGVGEEGGQSSLERSRGSTIAQMGIRGIYTK